MSEEFTRRRILRTGAAAAGLGGVGTASARGGGAALEDGDDVDARRIPERRFTDSQRRTETVAPSGVPERADGIRPGSQMFIEFEDVTAGCTANFVWRDSKGRPDGGGGPGNSDGKLYIGAAGHCFLPADKAASKRAATPEEKRNDRDFDTSGLSVSVCADCTFGGLTGLAVVDGAEIELGDVVYARQVEPNGVNGVGHDFGLVEVPSDAEHLVDPSLPQWGGPDGVSGGAIPAGQPVHQYGAGVANGEVYPTMGSTGESLGDAGSPESWFAAIRASPGDSGSPLVGSQVGSGTPEGGPAGGILTHLTGFGVAGTTMQQCKAMVERDVNLDVEVVLPGGG